MGIFRLPAVAGILEERFIEARLHTDYEENMTREKEMTGSIAQPIYLIVDPETGKLHGRQDGASLGDGTAEFIEFLEKGWSAARG